MNDTSNNFLKLIKKRIGILRFFITLIIIFLIVLMAFIINKNNKQNILINMISRQQMLTQMISKDVNQKLIVLNALSDGSLMDSKESLNNKVFLINVSLESSKNEYQDNLATLNRGILQYGNKTLNLKNSFDNTSFSNTMEKIELIDFSKSVEVIINNDKTNIDTDMAILYINTNNEQLLVNWNQMSQELIDHQKQISNLYFIIAIIIFLVFVIMVYISISQLNKYLVDPLNELYNGIKNFEMLKINKHKSFSTKNELTPVIDELLHSTLLALSNMAESRDEDTGDHLDRMKIYSAKIAEYLLEDHIYEDAISVSFIKNIEIFSPIHDIGKIGIRDGILLKPGQLTDEEFEIMKKHTIYGAEVFRTAEQNIVKQSQSMFKMGIEIAEGHHEKWNGTGYPYKKSGQNIPLSARIVAVADVLDALTSKRPYKKAFPFEESFKIIIEGKGNHFDPYIIDSLIKHKNDIYGLFISFKK